MITDRYGEPLAISTPVVSLWAVPADLAGVAQKKRVIPLLKALKLGRSELQKAKIKTFSRQGIYVFASSSQPDHNEILQLAVPGVYGQQEYRRFYPAGEVTAYLIGFTNIDDRGQEGVELAYNSWLQGEKGSKQVLKDLRGRVFKDVNLLAPARDGNDLSLSIDLLAVLGLSRIKEAVLAHKAKSGSVVLLDATTGEVLAMANQPPYNPNDRRGLKASALRNRAMTDQFESGSTMKPLTVMAALEAGRIYPNTSVDTNPGFAVQ